MRLWNWLLSLQALIELLSKTLYFIGFCLFSIGLTIFRDLSYFVDFVMFIHCMVLSNIKHFSHLWSWTKLVLF